MNATHAADDAAALQAMAQALGFELSNDEAHGLVAYLELLMRWNRTYNLTAVRSREGMLVQHLADCLALLPALRRRGAERGRLLDVGSGGGLPGVVIARCQPGMDVSCVDAVAKKTAFVRQAAGMLKLANLYALHGRVETLAIEPFDLITSRAFGSLVHFTALTRRLLAPGGAWIAMKGKPPLEEMAALPEDIDVFHVEPVQVPGLDAERCLVWMRPRRTS